ncbi:MAG: hypothetical protein H0U75_09040 [Legionella sp.]|nr:hypothetical protein [Legionella sp.]
MIKIKCFPIILLGLYGISLPSANARIMTACICSPGKACQTSTGQICHHPHRIYTRHSSIYHVTNVYPHYNTTHVYPPAYHTAHVYPEDSYDATHVYPDVYHAARARYPAYGYAPHAVHHVYNAYHEQNSNYLYNSYYHPYNSHRPFNSYRPLTSYPVYHAYTPYEY